MKIMKRTGRYLAAICFSVWMAAQPTAAKADVNQQQAPTLNVVYYNQADYPGEMIGGEYNPGSWMWSNSCSCLL